MKSCGYSSSFGFATDFARPIHPVGRSLLPWFIIMGYSHDMKKFPFLWIVLVLGLWGCQKPGPDKIDSDKVLYEKAEKLYAKKNYADAVEHYENLKNRFPSSPHAVESELQIANAKYEMGEYLEAAVHYQSFRTLHPSHDRIPFVLFRVGLCYEKDAPKAIDRDQSSLEKAIAVLTELREKWPTAKESEDALVILQRAKRALLLREMYVGKFYFKRKKYGAAIERFGTVRSQSDFPDLRDDATLRAARAQIRLKQYAEARASLEPVSTNDDSKYKGDARDLLKSLPKASNE